MDKMLSAKQLRAELPSVVERVRHGERFTILYRSRPAFRVVPVETDLPSGHDLGDLADEPLYRAGPLGHTRDGARAADHDRILYGKGGR
jgi:prevent-host-death family protein